MTKFTRFNRLLLGSCCVIFGIAAAPAWADADLQVSNFTYTTPQLNGATVSFVVTSKNNGDLAAANSRLRVFLPSSFSFTSAPSGCALSNPPYSFSSPQNPDPGSTYNNLRLLTCSLGSFAAGSTVVTTFSGTASAISTPVVSDMQADIYSDVDESALGTETDNVLPKQITVNTGADLALHATTPLVVKQGGVQIVPPDNAHVLNGTSVNVIAMTRNAGPNSTTSAQVTLTLPSTANFGSVSVPSGTPWSCSNASNTVTCNYSGPSVAAGAAFADISITGTFVAATVGTVSFSSSISSPSNTDPDLSNNGPASVNVTLDAATDLTANKQLIWGGNSVTSLAYGNAAAFSIGIHNSGPMNVPIGGAQVQDSIGAGWTIGTLPTGCTLSPPASRTVVCTNQSAIASGGNANFSIPVTAPLSGSPAGPNVATVTLLGASGRTEINTGNNSTSLTYSWVAGSADLGITKTKAPAAGVEPLGDAANITNTIRLSNAGSATAVASGILTVKETLSNFPMEKFVSASGTGWTCSIPLPGTPNDASNNIVTCTNSNAGGLAPGTNSSLLTVVTRTDLTTLAAGDHVLLSNTACTGSTADPAYTLDSNTANDCSGAKTIIASKRNSNVVIAKSVDAGGDATLQNTETTATYTLTISNQAGSDTIPSLTVSDAIPGYRNFPSPVGTTGVSPVIVGQVAGEGCTNSSGTVTCTLLNVAANAPRTITIDVSRPLVSGSLNNTATISSTTAFLSGTLSATAALTVDPRTNIKVSKSSNPNTAATGQVVLFTLTVNADGPDSATNLEVFDAFDSAHFTLDPSYAVTINNVAAGGACATEAVSGSWSGNATVDAVGGNGLHCNLGLVVVTPGNSTVKTIKYQAFANFPYAGGLPATYTDKVFVKTSTYEDVADLANNFASATVAVTTPLMDLTVSADDSGSDPTAWGTASPSPDTITYHLLATNSASYASAATSVNVVSIPLPPSGNHMTLQSGSLNANGNYVPTGFGCSQPGGLDTKVICAFDALPSGKTVGIDLVYDLTGSSPLGAVVFQNTTKICSLEAGPTNNTDPNCPTATATNYDQASANNSITEKTTVLPRTDLHVISKTASTPGPDLNEIFNWVVKVRNKGPADAPLITFTDTLPTGMRTAGGVSVSVGSGVTLTTNTCSAIGSGQPSVVCDLGPLPSDGNADGAEDPTKMVTITIPVKVDSSLTPTPVPGTYTNSASVSPAVDSADFHTPKLKVSKDFNAANDSASGSITVPQKAQLSGRVYYSAALIPNATIQSGGIAGVTVSATGTAGTGLGITRTTITLADGTYTLDNLPPGTYTLTEVQPGANYYDGRTLTGSITNGGGTISVSKGSGFVAGGANDVVTGILLNNNGSAINFNFEEYQPLIISGRVYLDANNNGVDNSETGISGAVLRLTGTTYTGAALSMTSAATTGTGNYSFTTAPSNNASGYTVTEITEPSGTLDGLDYDGSAVIAASAGRAAGTDSIPITTALLLPGATLSGRSFGELRPASIAGYAYVDQNSNAIKDGAETVLSNVVITLSGSNDLGVIAPQTFTTSSATNAGRYDFTNLRPGTYTVTETQPTGMTNTGAQIGTPASGIATAAAVSPEVVSSIVLASNSILTNYNFGHQGTALGGYVYIDSNRNGAMDGGEPGIAGVSVTLSGTAWNGQNVCSLITCTVVTGSDGSYSYANLPASDGTGYTIRERDGSNVASPPLSLYADGAEQPGSQGGNGSAVNDQISAIVIAANQTGTGYNFGEWGASVSGKAYIDVNDNGVFDSGTDSPLQNVTVTLSGTTATNASVCGFITCAVLTDVAGNFSYTNLPAANGGGYTLTESQPLDYANRSDTAGSPANGTASVVGGNSQVAGIAIAGGANVSGYLFGEKSGKISGYVYNDANLNGIKDGGENGIANVQLGLTGTSASGSPVNLSTTTDATGFYEFAGVLNANASRYTITETQPTGWLDGRETAGLQGGTVNNAAFGPNAAQNSISALPFSAASAATGYNFGELQSSSIAGLVYLDLDDNGNFSGSDTGLPGVTLTLTGTDDQGAAVAAATTTTTAADGTWSFSGLRPGTYVVTETQPLDYAERSNTLGSAGGSAGLSANNSQFTGIVLSSSGQTAADYRFGEKATSLAGFVFSDSNNDGIKDSGEIAIGGVSLTLSGTTAAGFNVCNVIGTSNCTRLSAGDGSYSFANLPTAGAAGYSVTEVQPAGWLDGKMAKGLINGASTLCANPACDIATANIISKIPVNAANTYAQFNFGELANASISGKVYLDANNNGQQDPSEVGIAAVTVTLSGHDDLGAAVNQVTATATDGSYSFNSLRPSDATGYTLIETQPNGYLDGRETVGTIGGTATGSAPNAGFDNTAGNNQISAIVLPAGMSGSNYLFGERGGTLHGFVFVDFKDATTTATNNNGIKDVGEVGLAGVHVTLSGTLSGGGDVCAVIASCVATTDAAGTFSFVVPPGSYKLVETQTDIDGSVYTDGKETAGLAGGTVNNATFGSQAYQNTIDVIAVTPSALAANGGDLGGYLFGEVPRSGPTLKPPIVSGYVYMDRSHTRVRPTTPEGQLGWTVQLLQNGTQLCTTTTNADGFYQFDNLHCPGYEASGLPTGTGFSITFSNANNRLPNIATSGGNAGTPGSSQINGITLGANDEKTEQNLPLDPSGIVYDSLTRLPLAGAIIAINGPGGFNPVTDLVGGSAAQTQTTGADGLYSFLLQNAFPSGTYTLTVTAPPNYLPAPSVTIPVCANSLVVGLVPTPALVQGVDNAPGLAAPAQDPAACPATTAGFSSVAPFSSAQLTTQYYFSFGVTNGASASILNNHIPLDPILAGAAILVTKITPMVNVARGDLVPYTVAATNISGGILSNVDVRDQIPPGFRYRTGSATRNSIPMEPQVNGRLLVWPNQNFNVNEKKTFKLMLVVGAGVGDGDYVNQAWTMNNIVNTVNSNIANAKVRVVPDPNFDCSDIIGKVFDDKNANGYQDQGEPGIPNVRVATPRGLLITTDADGRFHVTCADVPQMDHGSNFVLKLDERSLPSGYRMTTENPRDARLTRGKMAKLNFGATIHRVVRLEINAAAFNGDGVELQSVWIKQLEGLPTQLSGRPSVLRIAYAIGREGADLARQRLDAVAARVREIWQKRIDNGSAGNEQEKRNPLVIESELEGVQ